MTIGEASISILDRPSGIRDYVSCGRRARYPSGAVFQVCDLRLGGINPAIACVSATTLPLLKEMVGDLQVGRTGVEIQQKRLRRRAYADGSQILTVITLRNGAHNTSYSESTLASTKDRC